MSRRLLVAVAVVAALGAGAALGWYVGVPHYRPRLRPGESFGVDVSHHQGEIDWPRVATDGIEFAYVKATEGATFTDPRFAANWAGAGAAGLRRGAYHFFTLCTPGADQARQFLSVAPPDPAALAPAVDLELAGNCRDRPPPEAVQRSLAEFLGIVEAVAGRPVLLYLGADFAGRYDVPALDGRPLWLRRLLRRPDGGWALWQLHGWARVDGVRGPVDLNVMR